MKVVLFNGSPRKEGNTYHCLKIVMEQLENEGVECDYNWIGMEKLRGCTACMQCVENGDNRCVLKGDNMNDYIEKMIEADGIILGSPTYFADTATNIKALIERAGYATGGKLKHKVGAAVVAVRRAGATHVFSSINYFFLIKQMFVVGSSYWNLGVGKQPGDVLKDEEGIQTFKNLGQNFAFLLKKIHQ
ncbi:MAG: flavodoxin family protein [Promethearchaeota archaeon]|nr:MAG: flavodoxin family protein [Candidatus Lokiarchaeota archaeon]